MQFYFSLISQTFIPFFNLSHLLFISSIFYLIFKRHILAYLTLFLGFSVLLSKTSSEAYYQQLMPFIVICVGIFLSRLLVTNKSLIIFFIIFLLSSIFSINFTTYGLTLSDKINLVKQIGYYPEKFTVIAPGQEFPSITMPYEYLFWYYYRKPIPNTSFIINEQNLEYNINL